MRRDYVHIRLWKVLREVVFQLFDALFNSQLQPRIIPMVVIVAADGQYDHLKLFLCS